MRKFTSLLLILICLLSSTARSDDVVLIQAGETAKFSGLLFPTAKAQEMRIKLLEAEDLKALNASFERSIVLYKKNDVINNEKVSILMDQNNKLSKALIDSKEVGQLEKILWFAAGVLLSGVAVYGASQLRK